MRQARLALVLTLLWIGVVPTHAEELHLVKRLQLYSDLIQYLSKLSNEKGFESEGVELNWETAQKIHQMVAGRLSTLTQQQEFAVLAWHASRFDDVKQNNGKFNAVLEAAYYGALLQIAKNKSPAAKEALDDIYVRIQLDGGPGLDFSRIREKQADPEYK